MPARPSQRPHRAIMRLLRLLGKEYGPDQVSVKPAHQKEAPKLKRQRNINRQALKLPGAMIGPWILELLWSLELGFWSFSGAWSVRIQLRLSNRFSIVCVLDFPNLG